MDRTSRFHSFATSTNHGTRIKNDEVVVKPTTTSSFATHTLWLSKEINAAAEQVRLFREEAFKSTSSANMGSLTQSANILKDKIKDLETATKTVRDATTAILRGGGMKLGAQEALHMDKVLTLLEQKLMSVASDFRGAFDKRAKIATSRSERQENLFGQSKLHVYASSFALPPISKTTSTDTHPGTVSAPPRPQYPYVATTTTTMVNNNDAMRRRVIIQQPLFAPQDQHQHHNEINHHDDVTRTASVQQTMERKTRHESTRSHDVKRIEKMVGELGQMFMRVAGMVKEQGEMLDDIEMSVDDTVTQTNEAQTQLLKLFKFVSGDRSLIIKLLVVIMLLGMVVIYFWT